MANPTVYNSSNNGQTELVSSLTNPNGVEVTTSTSLVPTVTLAATVALGTLAITADSGATAIVNLVAGAAGTLTVDANGGTIDVNGLLSALGNATASIENGGTFIVEATTVAIANSESVTFAQSMGYTNTLVLNDPSGLLTNTTSKAIGGYFAGGKNIIDDKLLAGATVASYSITQATGQPQVLTFLDANGVSLGALSFAAGSFTFWQLGTYAVGDPSGPLHLSVGSDGGITASTNGYVMNGGGVSVPLVAGPGSTQTLVNTNGNPDNVTGSNGTIYFANAQGNVTGGGNTMYFDGSPNDIANLFNTNGVWDNVIGSNGTINLNSANTGVVGGGNTINLVSGTGNVASLWNTHGVWDNVVGSNGQVALNNAITGVVGGGNTITFASGTGNVASLWNTNGAWTMSWARMERSGSTTLKRASSGRQYDRFRHGDRKHRKSLEHERRLGQCGGLERLGPSQQCDFRRRRGRQYD